MEKNYRNIGFIFLLMIPITFFGFYRNYFSLFPDFNEDTGFYTHIHAFVASLWVLLLIIQPFLIRAKNYEFHRKLGKASYIIFPVLLLTFVPLMIRIFTRGDYSRLLFPVMDVILINVFYIMAIRNKNNVALHMRYMIAIPLVFLNPTLGRVFGWLLSDDLLDSGHLLYMLINLTLIALILWDKLNNRKYQPYVVALSGFITYQILYHIIFL